MKKENKQLAREKRAQAREKAAKKTRISNALKIWGPITGAVLVVAVMVFAVATSGGSDNGSSAADAAGDIDMEEYASLMDYDDASEPTLDTTAGTIVEDGDYINLDYVGYLDGEAFEGGNTMGMGTTLLIGSGSYIDGFEEGIIGHAVGETFDLNLTFPDPYPPNPDLANKDVVFTTTVNGIYE